MKLLYLNASLSRYFPKHIRRLKSASQMTSCGAGVKDWGTGFMPTFRIQGQAYHRLGSLLLPGNETHTCLQIYFYGGTMTEIETRLSFTVRNARDRLKDREVVVMLQEMLHNHSELVRQFKKHLADLAVPGQRLVILGDKKHLPMSIVGATMHQRLLRS